MEWSIQKDSEQKCGSLLLQNSFVVLISVHEQRSQVTSHNSKRTVDVAVQPVCFWKRSAVSAVLAVAVRQKHGLSGPDHSLSRSNNFVQYRGWSSIPDAKLHQAWTWVTFKYVRLIISFCKPWLALQAVSVGLSYNSYILYNSKIRTTDKLHRHTSRLICCLCYRTFRIAYKQY